MTNKHTRSIEECERQAAKKAARKEAAARIAAKKRAKLLREKGHKS